MDLNPFEMDEISVPTDDDIGYVFDGREYKDKEDALRAKKRKREKMLVDVAREMLVEAFGPDAPQQVIENFETSDGCQPSFEAVVLSLLDDADLDVEESSRVLLGQLLIQLGNRVTQGTFTISDPEADARSESIEDAPSF